MLSQNAIYKCDKCKDGYMIVKLNGGNVFTGARNTTKLPKRAAATRGRFMSVFNPNG